MKVRELIEKLQQFEQELEVLCFSEDLLPPINSKIFDICGIACSEGERRRGKDGTPLLKFGASPEAKKQVIIELTSDF